VTPAELLKRALARTPAHTTLPVTDELDQAIARNLERRGIAIAKVPGLVEDQPEDSLTERLARYHLETQALEAKWAAQRQAEQDATVYPQTTASIFHAAIAGASAPVSLNGMGVLRAAVAGLGGGTINGGNG